VCSPGPGLNLRAEGHASTGSRTKTGPNSSERRVLEARRARQGALESLTLYPIWRTARPSRTSLQPSAAAPAAPAPGPSCGPTCLGRRSRRGGIPLEGAQASSHAFRNISPSPDNSVANCDSLQRFFFLSLVLASERAWRPHPGRTAALAFSCCPHSHARTLSSLNAGLLPGTGAGAGGGKTSRPPRDFTGIALKPPFISLRGSVPLPKESIGTARGCSAGMLLPRQPNARARQRTRSQPKAEQEKASRFSRRVFTPLPSKCLVFLSCLLSSCRSLRSTSADTRPALTPDGITLACGWNTNRAYCWLRAVQRPRGAARGRPESQRDAAADRAALPGR